MKARQVALGVLVPWSLIAACGESERSPLTASDASDSQPEGGAPVPPDAALDAAVDADPADAGFAFDGSALPVQCAAATCFTRLVAGAHHYCGIAGDGRVLCWGDREVLGPVPDGAEADFGASPVRIGSYENVRDVDANQDDTCIAQGDGAVVCWSRFAPEPAAVPELVVADRVYVGSDGVLRCALGGGSLRCIGDTQFLGSGPRTVDLAGESPRDVALTAYVALVATEQGHVWSWGGNGLLLARPSSGVDPVPGAVVGLEGVERIAAADQSHACARNREGQLLCWGRGSEGALGLGTLQSAVVPTALPFQGSERPLEVATNTAHSCTSLTDGTVRCWGGTNARGQLGSLSEVGSYLPAPVVGLTGVASVAIGADSSCALLQNGSVQCWGDNGAGQLGRGARDAIRHPAPAPVVMP